jgi:hypothetical protein
MSQAVSRRLHSARARVQSRTGVYWWRKAHWDGIFCESFSLDPYHEDEYWALVAVLSIHLHVTTLIRTSGRSLRTCKHRNTISDIGAASARRGFSRFFNWTERPVFLLELQSCYRTNRRDSVNTTWNCFMLTSLEAFCSMYQTILLPSEAYFVHRLKYNFILRYKTEAQIYTKCMWYSLFESSPF